jgi:hypothetical protein
VSVRTCLRDRACVRVRVSVRVGVLLFVSDQLHSMSLLPEPPHLLAVDQRYGYIWNISTRECVMKACRRPSALPRPHCSVQATLALPCPPSHGPAARTLAWDALQVDLLAPAATGRAVHALVLPPPPAFLDEVDSAASVPPPPDSARARPCVAQRRAPPLQRPTNAKAESARTAVATANGRCRRPCLRLTHGPLNPEGATAPPRPRHRVSRRCGWRCAASVGARGGGLRAAVRHRECARRWRT